MSAHLEHGLHCRHCDRGVPPVLLAYPGPHPDDLLPEGDVLQLPGADDPQPLDVLHLLLHDEGGAGVQSPGGQLPELLCLGDQCPGKHWPLVGQHT